MDNFAELVLCPYGIVTYKYELVAGNGKLICKGAVECNNDVTLRNPYTQFIPAQIKVQFYIMIPFLVVFQGGPFKFSLFKIRCSRYIIWI